MYNIIHKKIINKNDFIIPKNPPNNIKTLKKVLNLTDKKLSEILNVDSSYLSSVINNRATFSGGVTLKLLKKLDVTFSFLYDVQKHYNMPCKVISDCIVIIESDTEITNIYQVLGEIFKEFDDSDNDANIIFYSKLSMKNNNFQLNINDMPFNLDIETINLYKSELIDFKYTANKDKFYYFIGAEIKNIQEKDLNINTYNSLDFKTLHLLQQLPFKKVKEFTMLNSSYTIQGNDIILEKPISRLDQSGHIKTVTKLKENEYLKLNDNAIVVSSLSDEETLNKLKLYRLIKGYNHAQMANFFGISKESYRLLELGHNKLTTHSMWVIENRLGILLEEMINIDMYCKKFSILK